MSTLSNLKSTRIKFISCGVIIYTVMLIAAGIIYYRQSMELFIPWYVNDYVNDFLCMPLVFGLLSSVMRKLKGDATFKFPLLFIMVLSGYYSVYFELYLPRVSSRYTGDAADVILYFLGSFVFYWWDRISEV